MFERSGRRAHQISCELIIALAAMGCATATAQSANESDTPTFPTRATTVNVCVTAEGVAKSVKVIRSSGNKRLDEAVLKLVYSGKFQPATRKGKAVPACMDMAVNFALKDEEPADAPKTENIVRDAAK